MSLQSQANTSANGSYPEVDKENNPVFQELYRIKVNNIQNGSIEVSSDLGLTWKIAGHVILPCEKVNYLGYTASKWAKTGCVAATAVNSLHIKTDYNSKDDRGVIFSIVPKELKEGIAYYNSFVSPDSSIYTDIPAGTSIFGGGYAPFVGNKLFTIRDASQTLYRIRKGYIPSKGDTIVIRVDRPVDYLAYITFENRFGGLITATYPSSFEKVVGLVLKPVFGVGRFSGTQFTDVGRLRANHSGVIDISTSPLGQIGGFQIIPANHGMSPEMTNARILTQWMVISSVSAEDPSIEGVAPFFLYFLNPNWSKMDLDDPHWIDNLMKRTLIEAKLKGSDVWQGVPEFSLTKYMGRTLPPWADTALTNVTHIRIWMPVYNYTYE